MEGINGNGLTDLKLCIKKKNHQNVIWFAIHAKIHLVSSFLFYRSISYMDKHTKVTILADFSL